MLFHKSSDIITIPADVPVSMQRTFKEHYLAITKGTGKLFLFACDQKIEHLNQSFFGQDIDPDDNKPEHLFAIAHQASVGAFATQLGLIARYGLQYPEINYIIKLNSKTNLVSTEQKDPQSTLLWSVEQVAHFAKQSSISIAGVGYTVYLGSEYESQMLYEAAQIVYQAHQYGLVAILWMYPRGKAVPNERDGMLIAGAAGVAATLGADFAKINIPDDSAHYSSAQWLSIAAQAGGNTKLICSGGKKIEPKDFLEELYTQVHQSSISGCAIGRNLHQRSLPQALAFAQAINALLYHNATVDEAMKYIK